MSHCNHFHFEKVEVSTFLQNNSNLRVRQNRLKNKWEKKKRETFKPWSAARSYITYQILSHWQTKTKTDTKQEARGSSRWKEKLCYHLQSSSCYIVGRKFAAQSRQLIFSSCKSNLVGCTGMSDRSIQALCNGRVEGVKQPEVHLSECKNKVFAMMMSMQSWCNSIRLEPKQSAWRISHSTH